MVLGDRVFCLCELRHSRPYHNYHGPNGRSGSLIWDLEDRKGSQTRSSDCHSGSPNRGPDCRKVSQSRSADGRSGSLTRARSRTCEGCCPRTSCSRSYSRSRSESRPTRCRRYQHCQGGKSFLVQKTILS